MTRHFFLMLLLALFPASTTLQAQGQPPDPPPPTGDYESAKVLLDRIVESIKGITTTLEGIEDDKTAKAATPTLEKQVGELRDQQSEASKLKLSDDEKKDLANDYKLKLQDNIKMFTREMIRVSKLPNDTGKPILDLLKRVRPR